MNINLRKAITRKVTYTTVTLYTSNEETIELDSYLVYGTTTLKREMSKILKKWEKDTIPYVKLKTVTEKRAITLEQFINNSIIINEGDR